MSDIPRETLIQDYQRVAEKLGKKPTLSEYNDHGKHSSTPIYDEFESFEELKDVAGFETGQQKVSDEDLLDDLRRVADEIGRTPPVQIYQDKGEYNFKTLKLRFGSWHDVQTEAGLEPTDHSEHWEDTDYTYELSGSTEVICDYCGETTVKRQSQVDRSENTFCDRDCKAGFMSEQTGEDARSWQGGKVEITCEVCGETQKVRPAKVDKSRFCSQDCMLEWRSDYLSGENHPRWTDSNEYRYYGPNWEKQSQQCRDRDNNECQVCGKTNEESRAQWDESLTAHHIIRFYDFEGYETANELPNLIASCKTCHGYLDSGRAGIPEEHEQRFREWVAGLDKTPADATVNLD